MNTYLDGQTLLTEIEAARFLGITPRTLRLWRRKRGVPHLRITGKVIRYRHSDLAGWLDRFRVAVIQR
ncbi:MAG: helix-turn-helix domain-containing protein [Verrucomicrobia bacterium]|nr:helix-turn-helix domain-containing protein [Verrucomicrobiota bacterium]